MKLPSYFLAASSLALLLFSGSFATSRAEGAESSPSISSEKVAELLRLLGDKEIQDWLKVQQSQPQAAAPEPLAPGMLASQRLHAIQQHFQDLAQAAPRIPGEVAKAGTRIRSASEGYGFASIVLLAASFVGFGLIADWLFRIAARRAAARTPVPEAIPSNIRLSALGRRLLIAVGSVAAFGIGSMGTFMLFAWPDLLRAIVFNLLVAGLLFSLAWNLMEVLLAPLNPRNIQESKLRRVIPMADDEASHWRNRIALAIGWFGFGYSVIQALLMTDVDVNVARLLAYLLGLGLLIIGVESIWRRPAYRAATVATEAGRVRISAGRQWFYTGYFTVLWLLWVVGTMRFFWLLVVAFALPLAIRLTRNTVRNLSGDRETGNDTDKLHGLVATTIERVLRAIWIVSAIAILAWAWDVGFERLTDSGDPISGISRAVLTVLAILLVIDLVWQLVKTLIDATLQRASEPSEPGTSEAIRRAKMRTLLPILRNVTMVFLATLAILMLLSSLGVQIAPLIASAGVVGVAIGFGAQTLVKDVISGMFYLLDDAFRVGEYIVTGSYRGTVESFSLRSVRLRHHRGPVFTIPFGELGAVQNLSRDFVVDLLLLTVTYDTDIEKARKLIKEIGQQLAADPALAPSIIEPLKMQAIGDFGEYGIQLKLKATTKPGEQFTLRKMAYPLIKKAFDENGIEFAFPTVKIAEGEAEKRAAAQHVLARKASRARKPQSGK